MHAKQPDHIPTAAEILLPPSNFRATYKRRIIRYDRDKLFDPEIHKKVKFAMSFFPFMPYNTEPTTYTWILNDFVHKMLVQVAPLAKTKIRNPWISDSTRCLITDKGRILQKYNESSKPSKGPSREATRARAMGALSKRPAEYRRAGSLRE